MNLGGPINRQSFPHLSYSASNNWREPKLHHISHTDSHRQRTLFDPAMIPFQFLPLLVAYWPHMLMGLFLYTMWFLVKDK